MLDDVRGGASRRKPVHRSSEERASIVAESYELGATVASVARRHGIVASQLSSWRSAARAGKSGSDNRPRFAEVSVMSGPFAPTPAFHDGVEIMVGAVVVRLPKSTPATRIVDIAQRLARQG